MRSEPDRNSASKFVVTEREAWFVSVEGDGKTPTLAEMLRAIFGGKINDGEFVTRADGMLDDGRMILGYQRKGGKVEIHSPLFVPYPSALRRLKEVFGDVEVVGMGWTASTGKIGRSDDE
jgi:hypothetical protein